MLVLLEPPVLLEILDDVEVSLTFIARSDLQSIGLEVPLIVLRALETDFIYLETANLHLIFSVVAVESELRSQEGRVAIRQLDSDSPNTSMHSLVDGD